MAVLEPRAPRRSPEADGARSASPTKRCREGRGTVYRATIDVSFRRSGGLFVVLHRRQNLRELVRQGDAIGDARRQRNDRQFDEAILAKRIDRIPRAVLVELSSLDGAVIVDSSVAEFSLGPAFDVRYSINANSTLFAVNVMEGITRAVIAPRSGNDPLAGWGAAVDLATGHLTHSEIALFGNVGAGTAAFVGGSRGAVLQRLDRALRTARRYSPSRYRPGEHDYRHQDMEALRRFRGSDVPLVMEVHRANEIVQVVNLTEDLNISLVLRGGTEAWQVADLLAGHGVPVIVDPFGNLPVSYDRLGARLDNAALLHRAGVRVLISSQETHNVRLLRQGAGNAVANGLPWIVALAGITRYPAEVFGLDDIGTLAVGARADIVIWSGDPLEVTTWAERVMVDGTWTPMRSRQTRLFERYKDLGGDKPFGFR